VPPKDFSRLGDAEAEAFFDAYVARAEPRLAEFRREVATTGGPSEAELDGSPDSLVGLWRWFVGRAPDRSGEPPPWYESDPPEAAPERLSAGTLRDVDGVALYLARAFRRALGELPWGIGRMPARKRYVSQNKPVLKGDGYDIDVLQVAYTLAMRAAGGRDTDDEALLRAFQAWVEPLRAR
jgi:hypothetical protein